MNSFIQIGNQIFNPHWITNIAVDEERREAVLYLAVSVSRADVTERGLEELGRDALGASGRSSLPKLEFKFSSLVTLVMALLREQAWVKFVGKDYDKFMAWLLENSEVR